MPELNESTPFIVRNCTMSAIATGERAGSLTELRDRLMTTHLDCIYFHFWGGRLDTQFPFPEFHNDFASWAHHALHDEYLAERFGIIDPTDYNSLNNLRNDLIDIVEDRLEESPNIVWANKQDEFHFIRSIIIVSETSIVINTPEDLPKALNQLPPSSIFYHFIDSRSRTPEHRDDFSAWLKTFGTKYSTLVENIESIDPYFLSLTELRKELIKIVKKYFGIIEEGKTG